MHQLLKSKLSEISQEEKQILSQNIGINIKDYTESKDFVIDKAKTLPKEKPIHIRTHTRFVAFPKHKHNFIEIIYMCSGSTTHTINDSDVVVLKQGELLFLNQYTYHSILPAEKGDIAINFMVLPEFFEESLINLKKDSVIAQFLASTLCSNSNAGKYLHFKCSEIVPIQNSVENLVWSLLEHQKGQDKINRLTMSVLLLQLLNYTDAIAFDDNQNYQKTIVFQILNYIETNYKTASLNDLAQRLNIKDYKICKILKKNTQKTFDELLLQKRLQVSKNLLVKTDLSTVDIISAVGYNNTSYFHRVFKKAFGVTPKEYRLQNRS